MSKKQIITHVVIPILIGSSIYLIYRSETLIMFGWFNALGVSDLVSKLRNFSLFNSQIPLWIKYSLPDGLWVYSLTSLMIIIWQDVKSKSKYYWIASSIIIAIVIELGQYLRLIPGTYDILDIILCLIAFTLAFLILYKK
tara:strand:- start:5050 stop:5469 length:420 start_codon:yes stop_codon:yes gene_type:complete